MVAVGVAVAVGVGVSVGVSVVVVVGVSVVVVVGVGVAVGVGVGVGVALANPSSRKRLEGFHLSRGEPSVRLKQNTTMKHTRLQRLSARIASLQVQFMEEKQRLRSMGVGPHEEATVYRVKRTKVKAYTRNGYVAVRVRLP